MGPVAVADKAWLAATVCTSCVNGRVQSVVCRRPSSAGTILCPSVEGTGRVGGLQCRYSKESGRAAGMMLEEGMREQRVVYCWLHCRTVDRRNCTSAGTCPSSVHLSRMTSPAFPVFYTQTCCYSLHQDVLR